MWDDFFTLIYLELNSRKPVRVWFFFYLVMKISSKVSSNLYLALVIVYKSEENDKSHERRPCRLPSWKTTALVSFSSPTEGIFFLLNAKK